MHKLLLSVAFSIFAVTSLIAQNLGVSSAGWLTGTRSGTPSQTCSATFYNGVFAMDTSLNLYQCSNVTGTYAWNVVSGGSGISSIGLGMPSAEFSVTGSPLTSNGSFTVSKNPQLPNTLWAGPSTSSSAPIIQSGSGSAGNFTFANPITSGHLLIVVVGSVSAAITMGNGVDTFSVASSSASFNYTIYYTCNAVGGTPTFTYSAAGGKSVSAQFFEYANNATSGCFDQANSASTNSGTTALSITTSSAVSQADELIFSAFILAVGNPASASCTAVTPGSGQTALLYSVDGSDGSDNAKIFTQVQNQADGLTGTQTASGTCNATTDYFGPGLFQVITAFKLSSTSTSQEPGFRKIVPNDLVSAGVFLPGTFTSTYSGTCTTGTQGYTGTVTDSNTTTYGATIAGSGANVVHAFCNGSNWLVD